MPSQSASAPDLAPNVDDQVEDLRGRMRLLQGDRRANIDILEANKGANKEEMKRMREENKELRVKIAQLQRGAATTGPDEEVGSMQRDVIKLRKMYDDTRSSTTRQKNTLQALKDEVRDLELEARRPNAEDSPLTRNIRMLENRLDKAMIKYNEAQSIRKTYEQIVKRLKEERIGFDNQLAALERTFSAKQRDYEELLLLSGDANHAREVAQAELERVRGGYEEERRRRESELRERHQVVQLRKQMQERIERRDKVRAEIHAQEAGDLGEAGEEMLKQAAAVNIFTSGLVEQERAEQRSKIDIFEAAFRKIKDSTGVSDVNEVIQKIISQEGTTENLMMLTKENQSKIESLNESRSVLKSKVEEIKYSGPGGGHRRKMVDDHEEQLTTSGARLERCRLKYERLAKMLITAKAGVKHLQDKLTPVGDELGMQLIEMTDETVVSVLIEAERSLASMVSRIRATAEEMAIMGGGGDDGAPAALDLALAGGAGGPLSQVSEAEVMQSRPYNQRIELPSADDEWDGDGMKADDGVPDVDEDELTRDKVKKAASQILIAQEKRHRVKGKRR